MDPTAPNDNQQNPQGNEGQQNPVQPGQFVVSGEPGMQPPAGNLNTNPQTPNIDPPAPFDATQQPPLGQDSSGPQLAGRPESFSQNTQPEPSQFSTPQQPVPPTMQPDPTPFTAPTMPPGPQAQGAQQQPDQNSKMANLKIIAIIVAVLLLVAIVAVVAWFFVFNKKSKEPTSVNQPINQVEEPTLPSPQTETGFGDIPQATQEATPAAQDQLPPVQ